MIYLDHAATTPMRPEILEVMRPYFLERFGNPSSLHAYGLEARKAIEDAREQIAHAIGATPPEIVFTSGGTESDNMALRGVLRARSGESDHIITSAIEHPAVLETCKFIEQLGHQVTYVPVDDDGRINPGEVEEAIRDNTRLISIMHANNEIGSIQPIAEVGAIAASHGVYMHTDAVQSVGKIPVDVTALNVDMLSISSHKIYGPKGVGCLYLRKGTKLKPLIFGGGHERGLRAAPRTFRVLLALVRQCDWRQKISRTMCAYKDSEMSSSTPYCETSPTLDSTVERSTAFRTMPISASATLRGSRLCSA